MEWNHILDKRPENGSVIIQLDEPYEFYKGDFKEYYTMGMREWDEKITWEDFLKWLKENNGRPPRFWWIYAKDFPFPLPYQPMPKHSSQPPEYKKE